MTDNRMTNPYTTNGYPTGYPPQINRPYQPIPLNLPPPSFNQQVPQYSYTNVPAYTTTYIAPVYTSYMVPNAANNGTTTTTTYITTYPAATPYGLSPPAATPYGLSPSSTTTYGLSPPQVTYQYAGYSPTATYVPNYTTPMHLQTYVQK